MQSTIAFAVLCFHILDLLSRLIRKRIRLKSWSSRTQPLPFFFQTQSISKRFLIHCTAAFQQAIIQLPLSYLLIFRLLYDLHHVQVLLPCCTPD